MIIATDIGLLHSWLVLPTLLPKMPEGTEYAVIAEDLSMPAPFTGKLTVLTKQGVDDKVLTGLGWEDAPKNYPNGVPLYEAGNLPTWQTWAVVDPLEGVSSEDIMTSVAIRKLVISPAAVEA